MVDEDIITTSLSQKAGIHTNLHIKEGLFGEYLPYPPSLVTAVLPVLSTPFAKDTLPCRSHDVEQNQDLSSQHWFALRTSVVETKVLVKVEYIDSQ